MSYFSIWKITSKNLPAPAGSGLVDYHGWVVQDDYDAKDLEDANGIAFAQDGFDAKVFKKGNEIVISFRGTDDPSDALANLGFITGRVTQQFKHAVAYVEALLSKAWHQSPVAGVCRVPFHFSTP